MSGLDHRLSDPAFQRGEAAGRLRVAAFVHSFPVLSETFVHRQFTGLAARGHTVAIYAHQPAADPLASPDTPGQGSVRGARVVYPYPNGSSRRRSGQDARQALGLILRHRTEAVRYLRAAEPNRLASRVAMLGRLKVLMPEPRPDLVHCHFGDVGLLYGSLARHWEVPLVVSFYGFDCSSFPRLHGPAVFGPLFRFADAVLVLSEHMRGRLLGLSCPPSRLRVHPLTVDTNRFRYRSRQPSPDRPGRLLTVARLVEKKGVAYALRAVARLAPGYPGLEYDIIGDGPLRERLEALSRDLGLGAQVRFLGARTESEVAAAMDSADIFLLPSVTASDGDEEGTPTVLLEASSCGMPVVSTRHAGIPEIILDGESGFLVPERDVAALAERLGFLLARPAAWATMGRAGRRHVEAGFEQRRGSVELEKLYRELVVGRSPARSEATHG